MGGIAYYNNTLSAAQVAAVHAKLVAGDANWWLGDGDINSAWVEGAYRFVGAANRAASYVNLANPGVHDLTPVNTMPAWSSMLGWDFDGIHTFLSSDLVPVTDQTWSAMIRFSDHISSGGIIGSLSVVAAASATNRFGLQIRPTGRVYFNGSAFAKSVGANTPDGVMAFAGNRAFYNGVFEGTIPGGSGVASWALIVGRQRFTGGVLTSPVQAKIQAYAIWNKVLSDAQVAEASAALAAL